MANSYISFHDVFAINVSKIHVTQSSIYRQVEIKTKDGGWCEITLHSSNSSDQLCFNFESEFSEAKSLDNGRIMP